jgi:hypothetical protein
MLGSKVFSTTLLHKEFLNHVFLHNDFPLGVFRRLGSF